MSSLEQIQERTTNKYNVLLKLLNKILVRTNHPVITDIIQFHNIDIDDILKEGNDKLIEEMEPEIYKYYDKEDLNGQKPQIKHNIIILIKLMCEDIDFQLKSKSVRQRDGEKVVTYSQYDIIPQNYC